MNKKNIVIAATLVASGMNGIVSTAVAQPVSPSASISINHDAYQRTVSNEMSIDSNQFYSGMAPSFVAWYLDNAGIDFSNNSYNVHWGNSKNWINAANEAGIKVSKTPVLGSVAVSTKGSYGHVAVVTAVNPDGTVTVNEYNYNEHKKFDERKVSTGEFDGYIVFGGK